MARHTPRPLPMLVSPVPPPIFPSTQQYAFQHAPYSPSYSRSPFQPIYSSPVDYRPPACQPSSSRTQSQPPESSNVQTPDNAYFSLPSSPASSNPATPELNPTQLPIPAPSLSHPIPPPPLSSACSFRSIKTPASLKRSTTLPQKKPTRSTLEKRSAVQLSLELKCEKAKGFIVIPLGRALPPAPPSSPVLGPRSESWADIHSAPINTKGSADYFGGWEGKVDEQEEWVEHNGMEVDMR